MNKVTDVGLKFNQSMVELFDIAFHDTNTIPTSILFDDLMVDVNLRAWEMFNGEAMVHLKWGMSFQRVYRADTTGLDEAAFTEFSLLTIYKSYMIQNNLPVNIIFIKVSPNEILIVGKDVMTHSCGYGLIDLQNKKIATSVGLEYLSDTLGILHAGLLQEYMTGTL